VWDALRDQSKFHHPSDGDAIPWAVDQIVAFLHREQKLALDMAKVVAPGTPLFESLNGRDGLVRRITQFDPGPIP
jgi:tetrahydromethanopterin S-methyltransferase subunit B